MENLTVVGMKELNQKLSRIDRTLEDIAKSLSTLVKIENRQFSRATPISLVEREEDEDDEV